ncbi:MAG TPA: RNA polymerase sigma factor [Casimicrobiaceae bacterium]
MIAENSLRSTAENDLASAAVGGNSAAFEALMRRYNRRLFRTARAILKDDAAAEDALQEAWVAAWRNLGTFRHEAGLSTWLTRIVVNQALQALRRTRPERVVVALDGRDDDSVLESVADPAPRAMPEKAMQHAEIRQLIERKIDELPEAFRAVFMLREVEELSVEETAACLDIAEATVRTRLFRARARLRESISRELDVAVHEAFGFAGARCDRIVRRVLERIAGEGAAPP